jgi:uncharacterized protein (DUF1330 family)
MTAYAIGHLRDVTMGPDIIEYLRRIDATLAPFDGQFIIHGGKVDVLEGSWAGDLIVIAFPRIDLARAWYASEAYRRIAPLRRHNTEGAVIIMDGVPPTHRATDVLAA